MGILAGEEKFKHPLYVHLVRLSHLSYDYERQALSNVIALYSEQGYLINNCSKTHENSTYAIDTNLPLKL